MDSNLLAVLDRSGENWVRGKLSDRAALVPEAGSSGKCFAHS